MSKITPIRLAAAAFAVLAVGSLSVDAYADSIRNSGPRPSFVPRSEYRGVSPGTFGRSDPTQGRIERDRLQIERFQDRSRSQALQRETLRELRPTVTDRRPEGPSNRLTDRLHPETTPLGHLGRPGVSQADRELTPSARQSDILEHRGLNLDNRVAPHADSDSSAQADPYAHIDRETR